MFSKIQNCLKSKKGIAAFPISGCWYWAKKMFFAGDRFSFCVMFQLLCAGAKIFNEEGAFRISNLFKSYVFIYKPCLIKELINHPDTTEKDSLYEIFKGTLGEGLLTSNGEKWSKHRKIITPSFRMDVLKNYLPIFNYHAAVLVDRLNDLAHQPYIEIDHLVNSCLFDIIYESAMGLKINMKEHDEQAKEYFSVLQILKSFLMYRQMRPWTYNETIFSLFPVSRNFLKAQKISRGLIKKVTEMKKINILREMEKDHSRQNASQCKLHKAPKRSFLDSILTYHLEMPSFTLQEVEEEVATIMAAGEETSALTVKWVIFLLGLHPEIQENVIAEVDSLFDTVNEREVIFDDLQQLKYMECVIKETLRLYPPAAVFSREVKEDIQIGTDVILRGTCLVFFTYMLHRDPYEFPDAEKFIPERFLPENREKRHPFSYIPFSAGGRSCIGSKFAIMEIKVVITHILRNFRIVSLCHRDQVQLSLTITLQNEEPLKIRLIPRR